MILGSDSHTRYGALGTMAVGEGGGELVNNCLMTPGISTDPGVVAVDLTGKPAPYVGPQDVALAIIGAVFKKRLRQKQSDGVRRSRCCSALYRFP